MCICDWLTSIKLLWQENNWTHGGRGRPCPVHPCSEPSQLHKNCHIHTTILHEFATIVDIAWTDGQRFYIINNFLGTKIIVIFLTNLFHINLFQYLVYWSEVRSLPRPAQNWLTHWCCWDLTDMTSAAETIKTWDFFCTLRNSVISSLWPPPRPP